MGSHIDTVRDAGRFDGNYGALAALAVVEGLAAEGTRLDHAIEIVAFGDEEGVRYRTTLTGSLALAGAYPEDALDQRDSSGVSMRDALTAFGGDPDKAALIRRENVAAFVEAHIEQGPVLEAEGLPLEIVTAINGATRLEVSVDGMAGHAGATPMHLRRDALAAAAEMILGAEARARSETNLVATVGRIEAWPGATNVIPGVARFSVDLRAPDDFRRAAALADLDRTFHEIAAARGVRVTSTTTHEAPAYVCDPANRRGRRAGGRGGGRAASAPSLGRRSRYDGDGAALPGGDALCPLQGRDQPQSAGIDHARRLRVRPRGALALRAGFQAWLTSCSRMVPLPADRREARDKSHSMFTDFQNYGIVHSVQQNSCGWLR